MPLKLQKSVPYEPAVIPAEVPQHDGSTRPLGAELFVAPPQEIGELRSAATLREDQHPMSANTRFGITLVAAVIGAAIGYGIAWFFELTGVWSNIWVSGIGVVGILIGYFNSSFGHTCTYVGKNGTAKSVCHGSRTNVKQCELFLFEKAGQLFTSLTDHYTNGLYTNTVYDFTWKSGVKPKVYQIAGSHNNREGRPKSEDSYHFARAAEMAWTDHLFERVREDLRNKGYILFSLANGNHIKVGQGFIEFLFNGKTARCDVDVIEGIQIKGGVFTIKRRDAKVGWFRKDGVFEFQYAQMPNALLFLTTLDKLGLPINS